MPSLLDRAKSTVQRAVSATPSPEREARRKAAAELLDIRARHRKEVTRTQTLNDRERELAAAIATLETEEADAQRAKAAVLVAFATGDATEEAIVAANARLRDVATRISDRKDMYQAVAQELAVVEADWPPSPCKQLSDSKERLERMFNRSVFDEVSKGEAPAGVQDWIRRCWAFYRYAGHGGLQGMFGELFPKEFSNVEMEALRNEMESEFLNDVEQPSDGQ